MSTSPVYDSTRQALQPLLPTIRDSQMETLALLVASATQTQSAHLGQLARPLLVNHAGLQGAAHPALFG